MTVGNAPLPLELAPGIFWLGDCMPTQVGEIMTHSYTSAYAVSGDDSSVIVDTGPPKDWSAIDRQLDELIDRGAISPVRYVFATHPEVAHSANLGRLLHKFPDAVGWGEVRDYHLAFPDYADRLVPAAVGDVLDLGARPVSVVRAVFKDLHASLWAFDEQEHVLFPGDGFSYMHYHDEQECGRTAEQLPELPIPEFTAVYNESAFYWTRFCDIEQTIAELEAIFDEREIRIVCPGHGAPIMDPPTTLPKIVAGLRLGTKLDRAAIGELMKARQTA